MYQIVLSLHNAWRWVVVLILVIAIVQFLMGWLQRKNWTSRDKRTLMLYTTAIDIQVVLGFLLFFVLSPLTTSAFSNFGEAMRNSGQRFFLVEHTVLMVVAVIVAHVSSIIARKQATDVGKFRIAAIGAIVVAIAILAGIPWMRPLIPVF